MSQLSMAEFLCQDFHPKGFFESRGWTLAEFLQTLKPRPYFKVEGHDEIFSGLVSSFIDFEHKFVLQVVYPLKAVDPWNKILSEEEGSKRIVMLNWSPKPPEKKTDKIYQVDGYKFDLSSLRQGSPDLQPGDCVIVLEAGVPMYEKMVKIEKPVLTYHFDNFAQIDPQVKDKVMRMRPFDFSKDPKVNVFNTQSENLFQDDYLFFELREDGEWHEAGILHSDINGNEYSFPSRIIKVPKEKIFTQEEITKLEQLFGSFVCS